MMLSGFQVVCEVGSGNVLKSLGGYLSVRVRVSPLCHAAKVY